MGGILSSDARFARKLNDEVKMPLPELALACVGVCSPSFRFAGEPVRLLDIGVLGPSKLGRAPESLLNGREALDCELTRLTELPPCIGLARLGVIGEDKDDLPAGLAVSSNGSFAVVGLPDCRSPLAALELSDVGVLIVRPLKKLAEAAGKPDEVELDGVDMLDATATGTLVFGVTGSAMTACIAGMAPGNWLRFGDDMLIAGDAGVDATCAISRAGDAKEAFCCRPPKFAPSPTVF